METSWAASRLSEVHNIKAAMATNIMLKSWSGLVITRAVVTHAPVQHMMV
jgi:hypothetical protein